MFRGYGNSESVFKRKLRFWAFLTAFVMTFSCLGPAMVMARNQEIPTGNSWASSIEGKTLEPGNTIAWYYNNGNNPNYLKKVYYFNPGQYVAGQDDYDTACLGYDEDDRDGHGLAEDNDYHYVVHGYDYFAGQNLYRDDVNEIFLYWKVVKATEENASGGGRNITLFLEACGDVTINFDANGGVFADGKTVTQITYPSSIGEDPLPEPHFEPDPNPYREGYKLSGWEIKYPNDEPAPMPLAYTPDLTPFSLFGRLRDCREPIPENTVFAIWEPADPVNVIFKTKDGDGAFEAKHTESVPYCGKATEYTPDAREGMSFDGWYTDEACSADKKFDFSTIITQETTLYGKWPKKPATDSGIPFDQSGKLLQVVITKRTGSSLTLEWNRIEGADGYLIYGRKCHTFPIKKIADIPATDAKTYTFTQNDLKIVRGDPYYKYKIRAYKIVNGKRKKTITWSLLIHGCITGGSNTVAKGVKINSIDGSAPSSPSANSITLKVNQKVKIKAEEEVEESGKVIAGHRKQKNQINYQTNDIATAKVNKKGTITGVAEGKCKVYAVAQDGFFTVIDVTVEPK